MKTLATAAIYKWNTETLQFTWYRALSSFDAIDATVFTRNYFGNIVYVNIASRNGTLTTWFLHQHVWTTATMNIEPASMIYSFSYDLDHLIASVSVPNNASCSGYIHLYKVQGMTLLKQQSINAPGPQSVSHFIYEEASFIIVTNKEACSFESTSTYYLTIDIYRYSATLQKYLWFQSIPTYKASHSAVYQIGTSYYMIVTELDKAINIYQFGDELGFYLIETLKIEGVQRTIAIDNNKYIMAASKILKISSRGMSSLFNFVIPVLNHIYLVKPSSRRTVVFRVTNRQFTSQSSDIHTLTLCEISLWHYVNNRLITKSRCMSCV